MGAVIDVRSEACDDAAELDACGMEFLHLPTQDTQGISKPMLDAGVTFARAMRFEGRKLLIHCEHGIGRSATLALCIMVDRGAMPLKALAEAKDARELISPSESQYRAWTSWIAHHSSQVPIPTFHEFGMIAYRNLAQA